MDSRQVNIRLSKDIYNDLVLLKDTLKLKDTSSAVRFAIIYAVASIEKLDEQHISESLAVAISNVLFDKNGSNLSSLNNSK